MDRALLLGARGLRAFGFGFFINLSLERSMPAICQ